MTFTSSESPDAECQVELCKNRSHVLKVFGWPSKVHKLSTRKIKRFFVTFSESALTIGLCSYNSMGENVSVYGFYGAVFSKQNSGQFAVKSFQRVTRNL